ncbi:MAG: Gfo/Idh/MocA family oxidoreductase [Armatimonadetes bacterium]|nr:Gfo/Idh/MocA family oxidoreductase [Armatimonadota bacterium]
MGRAVAGSAASLDGVSVDVVCDLIEQRRGEAAEQFGAVPVADYREAVARDDIDAVIVAPHGSAHRPVVEAAAAAGKHIFCEKPLAPSLADCDAMIAAVKAAGVKVQVGQVCRWHPTHRRLKQMVADGPLGDVVSMYVERSQGGWGGHPTWRLSREMSGGTLLEVNAHELDLMIWIAGPVKRVAAVGNHKVEMDQDYPDVTHVSMVFESGAVGVLQSTNIATVGTYQARMDCVNGSAVVSQLFGGEVTYRLRGSEETLKVTPEEMAVENPVTGEVRAFVNYIRCGGEAPVPFEQARLNVAVANAAYESIETGQFVDL